jgi:hypothetical protein
MDGASPFNISVSDEAIPGAAPSRKVVIKSMMACRRGARFRKSDAGVHR